MDFHGSSPGGLLGTKTLGYHTQLPTDVLIPCESGMTRNLCINLPERLLQPTPDHV